MSGMTSGILLSAVSSVSVLDHVLLGLLTLYLSVLLSADRPKTPEGELEKNKVKLKLIKWLLRRPTLESLQEKGIIRGLLACTEIFL